VVGEDALLIAPRHPGELRDALDRLIQDEGLRNQLGRRARARVEREFGWRGIARRYVELYRQTGPSRRAASHAPSWRHLPAAGRRLAPAYRPARSTTLLRDAG
jgi:hypothetical protein